jgi:hypothetical protein
MNAPLQDASTLPIDAIDVSDATLFQQDAWRPYVARLRAEDPVHWSENDLFGGFWSVTRFEDVTVVDGNHSDGVNLDGSGSFRFERAVAQPTRAALAIRPRVETSPGRR